MSVITKKQAIEKLQELVAIRGGDYVYDMVGGEVDEPQCRYSDPRTGNYSCGVGYVIQELAPETFKVIRGMENQFETSVNIGRLNSESFEFWGWPRVSMTPAAFRVLDRFQAAQDSGVPYRFALSAALNDVAAEKRYAK